jgi:hypothetical protein
MCKQLRQKDEQKVGYYRGTIACISNEMVLVNIVSGLTGKFRTDILQSRLLFANAGNNDPSYSNQTGDGILGHQFNKRL